MMKISRNAAQEKKVAAYFQETDSSYRNWGDTDAYSLHYGYHDVAGMDQRAALTRMNEIMAQQVGIKNGERLLDAGCGVGATSIWLAKTFGVEAHGLSLSPLQVKKAKSFAKANNVSKLAHFYLRNFLSTGFPSNHFDIVWFQESSSQTYEKAGFLKEAFRVLKPGGRVIVTDLFLTKEKMTEMEKHCIDKWCDGWAMAYLPSIKDFGATMKKCKYANIRSIDNTKFVEESANNIYVRGKEGYPDDALTKAKTVVRLKHTEANAFQGVALKLGLWKHLTFIGQKPASKK
jgi:cyclopropane fatty-acyl-phospholipid synthase-like methyltransferase